MSNHSEEALAAIIRRAVIDALNETKIFPLYSTLDLASIFKVSVNTVLSWRQQGLLKAHCHAVSGCAWRWLFTHRDVMAFFDANFPSEEDVKVSFGQGSEFNPRTNKVVQMQKMLAMRKLFSRTHSRRRKAADR